MTYVKASNTDASDRFGDAIAVSGDGQTLAVGARGEASNGPEADDTQPESGAVYIYVHSGAGWTQQAYLKASNIDFGDRFGFHVALSDDGDTLAVSAIYECGCSQCINGDETSDGCGSEGAVYVFTRQNGAWTKQANIKASNAGVTGGYSRGFGSSLALSADGNTLAVGGAGDSSNATGIDGNQANTSMAVSGAVYVFTRNGATWTQQAYVKASNTGAQDVFGSSVALSSDGNVMAVGAPGEWSAATGVDGNQADNSMQDAGAVYMFTRQNTTWTQRAYIKASNTNGQGFFGHAVALSAMGDTLIVGARGEASAATGIDGNQADNSELHAGAVYVFTHSGTTWSQQAYVKEARSKNNDSFGMSVDVSADGDTFVAGAPNEGGGGTGVTTLQSSMAIMSGAVCVFHRIGTTWAQQHYIKSSNSEAQDSFGTAVACSNDATLFAAGAKEEDSNATGIGGDPSDNSAQASGAVYLIR